MKTVSTMGSGSLGCELDLDVLVSEIENKIENSLDINFTSDGIVTLRFDDDGPAFTIYRTGTFQIRGAKTTNQLQDAKRFLLDLLNEIDLDFSHYEFEHITSVFVADLRENVNLSGLAIELGLESTEYEPEQFPGLVYRPEGSRFVFLIFSSGKTVITGGKFKKRAENEFRFLEKRVNKI
jgi:transcription initiation factor TFIID TATA-box-binding protein